MTLSKKTKIVGLALLSSIVLLGVAFFFLIGPGNPGGAEVEVFEPPSPRIEVFSLAAVISKIDAQQKLIILKHPTQDKDISVIVRDDSEILRVEFPFDPKNPPSQASFAPKYTKIALQDLKPGNHALIESNENIYNKYEFDNVKSIQVLP